MPASNAEAATTLCKQIEVAGLTRKQIAIALGRSESWLSRRLSGPVGVDFDDFSHISAAIDELRLEYAK